MNPTNAVYISTRLFKISYPLRPLLADLDGDSRVGRAGAELEGLPREDTNFFSGVLTVVLAGTPSGVPGVLLNRWSPEI